VGRDVPLDLLRLDNYLFELEDFQLAAAFVFLSKSRAAGESRERQQNYHFQQDTGPLHRNLPIERAGWHVIYIIKT